MIHKQIKKEEVEEESVKSVDEQNRSEKTSLRNLSKKEEEKMGFIISSNSRF